MTCRKNHQRQLEALQHSVEEETRGKAEQARQKKAMEEQLNELQSSIDEAQKVHSIPSSYVHRGGSVMELHTPRYPIIEMLYVHIPTHNRSLFPRFPFYHLSIITQLTSAKLRIDIVGLRVLLHQ